ncbi:putative ATP-dependent DNA helicase RecS [Odontesthes bonariensis]|uniref:putative ATP-dependent DNA helicase RecS n=1 Tax=Odontesthes bonariensis TaxID=219752 RepID=UPI003F58C849
MVPLVLERLGRPNTIAIVVCPLVALMEDQVREAKKLGVRAGQLGVDDEQQIIAGHFSLVFGSPEAWLLNSKWRRMLNTRIYQQNLVGIVVDEAHVTYKWGQAAKGDNPFRESFSKLGELRSIAKAGTPFLALTASADIQSRSRVTKILQMDNAIHIIASPNKTNIRLGICRVPRDRNNCLDWIVRCVADKGTTMQPVLIYCPTMQLVGKVFGYLKAELQSQAWVDGDPDRKAENLLIGMFHSKTLQKYKDRVLSSLRGEGNCRVVVATTALGMGLNFPNVSHIVMFGAPGDLETIVQQVGRAGRQGQQAHAILYDNRRYINVDKEVTQLLTVKNSCVRKYLYTHFEEEPTNVNPGHLCCTFCHTVCACSSGICTEPTPNYEQQLENKQVSLRSRTVNDKDRSAIADLLDEYRVKLMNSSPHLVTSFAACTGFSQELVDAVLSHCEHIFDLAYIMNNLPVFILEHAKEILIIIADVFGDFDLDVQSGLVDSFCEPDLYFRNYFDDDDLSDASRSQVSSESDY